MKCIKRLRKSASISMVLVLFTLLLVLAAPPVMALGPCDLHRVDWKNFTFPGQWRRRERPGAPSPIGRQCDCLRRLEGRWRPRSVRAC